MAPGCLLLFFRLLALVGEGGGRSGGLSGLVVRASAGDEPQVTSQVTHRRLDDGQFQSPFLLYI